MVRTSINGKLLQENKTFHRFIIGGQFRSIHIHRIGCELELHFQSFKHEKEQYRGWHNQSLCDLLIFFDIDIEFPSARDILKITNKAL